MTTKPEEQRSNATTQDQEPQPTEEQQRLEAEESEAGFAAGFKRVARAELPPADKKDAGETKDDATATGSTAAPTAAELEAQAKAKREAEATAKAEAEKAEREKQWEGVPKVVREKLESLDALPGQVRNLAGHIGGLKSSLDQALATAKAAATKAGGDGAAPTEQQVKAAMADPKAWEKIKEDFPDWAAVVEGELNAIRSEIAKKGQQPALDVGAVEKKVAESLAPTIQASTRLARELAQVDIKHEGWEETVKTPEFKAWLPKQPDDVKALARSERGRDAIALMDKFKAHQEEQRKQDEARQRKQKRLEQGVVPEGGRSAPDSGISDEDAFARGFKRGRGK